MAMSTFLDYLHARDDAHRTHRAEARRAMMSDDTNDHGLGALLPPLPEQDVSLEPRAMDAGASDVAVADDGALGVGERVEARFQGGHSWFRGVVQAVRCGGATSYDNEYPVEALLAQARDDVAPEDDGGVAVVAKAPGGVSFDVSYDDGDFETHVPSDGIRRETPRPAPTLRKAGHIDTSAAEEDDSGAAAAEFDEGPVFEALNHAGVVAKIPLLREGLYLIDFDLPRHLPELASDLAQRFKLDLLPRGSQCLLRFLPSRGHPFMGPNLYVTPPGTFTHFHQDGHGTVDSGHQCLRGHNEVVMLRRLDDPNKRRALRVLCGAAPGYDALYGKPHDNGAKPPWPTSAQIDHLRALGYCPSVFTLGPGEYVHINKGRLHAFRKKSPPPGGSEQFCVSVAWDWLYQGSSPEAVAAELRDPLACAALNARANVPSLSHTDAAVLHAALAHAARREATAELAAAAAATAAPVAATAAATEGAAGTSQTTAAAKRVRASNSGDLFSMNDGRHALLDGFGPAVASVVARQRREAAAATFAQTHGRYEAGPSSFAANAWSGNGGLGGGTRRRGTEAPPKLVAAAAPPVVTASSAEVATAALAASPEAAAAPASVAAAAFPVRVLSLEAAGVAAVDVNVPAAARLVASAPPVPRIASQENEHTVEGDGGGDAAAWASAVEDPWACDAYVCRRCQRELAHAYLQCVGCRALLRQPLHLCAICHAAAAHVAVAPDNAGFATTRAHFTPRSALAASAAIPAQGKEQLTCGCGEAPCPRCNICAGCGCGCHLDFELRYRFMLPAALAELARAVPIEAP
jgi:hypothetical protein